MLRRRMGGWQSAFPQDRCGWDRAEEKRRRDAELTSCTYRMYCTHNANATVPAPEFSGSSRIAWGGLPTTLDSGRRGNRNPCSAAKSVSVRSSRGGTCAVPRGPTVRQRRRPTRPGHAAAHPAAPQKGGFEGSSMEMEAGHGDGGGPGTRATCKRLLGSTSTAGSAGKKRRLARSARLATGKWQREEARAEKRSRCTSWLRDLTLHCLPCHLTFPFARPHYCLSYLTHAHISHLSSRPVSLSSSLFSSSSAKQPTALIPTWRAFHFHIGHTRISPSPSTRPPRLSRTLDLDFAFAHHLPVMSVRGLGH